MPSPTDLPAADTPPDDLDLLLGAAIEAAARLLSTNGEFYPFAIAVDASGELVAPEIRPEGDHPAAEEVLDLLVAALREGEGLRATVLCSDVRLADRDSDAIRLDLEPREGDALTVLVPYVPGPVLDDPFGVPGTRRVFA
jgi:hypothetical protein